MDTRDLSLFSLAYESGSFSTAAGKAFMSPQGFAKAIRRLEAELDAPLFERSANGIRPTAYADSLYHKVNELTFLLNEIASFEGRAPAAGATLTVYAVNGVLNHLGYGFFEGFRARHPGTVLCLPELPDAALLPQFEDRNYHLGFLTGPVDPHRFESTYVFTVRQRLIMRRDHPLAAQAQITPADISGVPLAIRGRAFADHNRHYNMLRAAGCRANIALETSNDTLILDFTTAGHGIGLFEEALVERPPYRALFESGELISAELSGLPLTRGIFFAVNRHITLTPIEEAFRDYVAAYLKSHALG